MARRSRTAVVYQLRIDLRDIRPPIWRRVLVPGDMSLADLHNVIQTLFNWLDYHLHIFDIFGLHYGVPDPDDFMEVRDENDLRLATFIAGEGVSFDYTYDFGDDWRHSIKVEKILEPDAERFYPVCIKGRRNGPPEDVGGPWGYAEFLETIADPDNEEYEDMLEWVGGEWDGAAYDEEAINQRLRHLFSTAGH